MSYTNARSSVDLRTMFTSRPMRIAWMLLAAALVLVSCTEEDVPVDPGPQIKVEEIEARVLLLINEHREGENLPLLTLADAVTLQARIHSANMAAGTVSFGHDGIDQRIAAVTQTIPISAAAENVASNYGFQDPAAQAVSSWLNSADHLRNIEGDYDLTGIGVARNASGVLYYTQMFVKSR